VAAKQRQRRWDATAHRNRCDASGGIGAHVDILEA
jgi:hypothetical protein